MIVDIFTLCDSAKEYQGKLVIVGTFNTISAIQFPATHPELAIVARIVMGNQEKGKHTLKISIKKRMKMHILLIHLIWTLIIVICKQRWGILT